MLECPECKTEVGDELFSHIREEHGDVREFIKEHQLEAGDLVEDIDAMETRVTSDNKIEKRVEMWDFGFWVDEENAAHKLVPEKDEDFLLRQRLGKLVAYGLDEGHNILLKGPAGVGKSTTVTQICARLEWPCMRVDASEGLYEGDFVGEKGIVDGETIFQYGLLPMMAKLGGVLIIDEFNALESGVGFFVHQLMEDNGRLVILENGGEVIEPHDKFRIVGTTNSLGWDNDSGLYAGTKTMNAALLDRWHQVLEFDYPVEEEELEILKVRVPELDEATAYGLVEFAARIREAIKEGTLYGVLSTRSLINVGRMLKSTGLELAIEIGLINKFPVEDREAVKETMQRVFGDTE